MEVIRTSAQQGTRLPTTQRRLALASIVASGNPNSRLVAPASDLGDGAGIRISLTGGWTSTDWAGAHPYWVWEILDVAGVAIGGDDDFSLAVAMAIRAHPGDASDTDLRVAIVNETDLTSATIDGMNAGIRWTADARGVIVSNVSNGTASAVGTGTGVAGAAYMRASFPRFGEGAASTLVSPRACLLNSSRAYIASSNVNQAPGNGVVIGNPSKLYLALVAGRSATTAGDVTIDVDVYYAPPLKLEMAA